MNGWNFHIGQMRRLRLRTVFHTAMPQDQVLEQMETCLSLLRNQHVEHDFQAVSAVEVAEAIKGTQISKSMGTDGMTNEMFQALTHLAVEWLSDWFTRLLSGRLPWPEVWTLADVLMLPKSALPKSIREYRPIAITAVSYKIFMRIVTRRLQAQIGGFFCGKQALASV